MYPVNGVPMIHYSFLTIKDLPYDKIISTDDKLVKSEAAAFGLQVHDRKRNLADDRATLDEVIYDLAKEFKHEIFVFLPPTSPLRTAEDIECAINLFLNTENADSLISVTHEHRSCWTKVSSAGFCTPLYVPDKNRQEERGYFVANGAIFISYRDAILRSKRKVSGRVITYVMEQNHSVDVHNEQDVQIAEFYLIRNEWLLK